MARYSGWFSEPTDIMEHIGELKFYCLEEEARDKLLVVARYIDNPLKLKELEEEWLYGRKDQGKKHSYRGIARTLGWDWD